LQVPASSQQLDCAPERPGSSFQFCFRDFLTGLDFRLRIPEFLMTVWSLSMY
jgi:hypothetical protein